MKIVKRSEWGALAARSYLASDPKTLEGVVVHWFGSPRAAHNHKDCPALLRSVQRGHQAGEFNDIAYGHCVCPHGIVYEGRGFYRRTGANGTGLANLRYGSVVVMMGEGDKLTGEAKNAVAETIREYRRLGAGPKVLRHGEITGSACPGPELSAWVKAKGYERGDAHNRQRLAATRAWILKQRQAGRSWAWLKRTPNFREFIRRGGK